MGKSRHKHKCIASLSCDEDAPLCDKEAEYPEKEHDMRYAGLSDNVTRKYCRTHWEQLKANNGEFICIGVETAENGSCQLIDAKGTGRNIILKGDIGVNDEGKKVCNATSPRNVRGGSVYGVSVRSSSPYGVRSPRSPGSVVLSPMTFNSAGSPVVRAGSVRGPASVRSGTMIVGTKPAGSIKSKKMKKDEDSDSSDSDSDASSVSTDSSSDSDSSDSDSSCDSYSETSSISSCEDDDAIKNRRKSKKRKTKLKTSGISKRKRKALMKRNIRPAPPFTREKNPPIINIKYELAKKLVVIDSTYNITEAMDNMKSFINIIHSQNAEDEHNKDYSYVVTEDVVDKVAKLLKKFMYNPLRIEMVLSFLFNYETRDSSTTFDFYGFKKPAAETNKLISSYKDIYQKSPVSYQMELSYEGVRDRIAALKMEYEGTGPKYNNGSTLDKEIKNLFLRLNNPTNRDDVFMEYEKVNDKYTIFKAEFAKTKNAGTAEAATTAKYSTGERPVDAGAAAAAVFVGSGGMPPAAPSLTQPLSPEQIKAAKEKAEAEKAAAKTTTSGAISTYANLTDLFNNFKTDSNVSDAEKVLLENLSSNNSYKTDVNNFFNDNTNKTVLPFKYENGKKIYSSEDSVKILHNFALFATLQKDTNTKINKPYFDKIFKEIKDIKSVKTTNKGIYNNKIAEIIKNSSTFSPEFTSIKDDKIPSTNETYKDARFSKLQ